MLAGLSASISGCQPTDPVPGRPSNPLGELPDQRAPLPCGPHDADELFSAKEVWDISIRLDDEAIAALHEDPFTYVEGGVRIADVGFDRVGVRLKGAYSFQTLAGKAAFKIEFDEFVPGQYYLGLERLTLNNMRQDRSKVHEWLGYQLFAAAGVAAPRTGYARVRVNGADYGLYANIESVDDSFLEERFADPDGNLYEAPWGADLDPESLWSFEQDEGADCSRDDLAAFIDAVGQPGDAIFFAADTPLATDEFLAFVASEAAIGHWDGYWKANNYRIYHEPTADQWSFIPWGIDQTLERELAVFSGRGLLIEKCIAEPTCLAAYAETGLAVAEIFADLELSGSLDQAAALIADALAADPRQPHPVEMVARYQERVRANLATAPDRLRAAFDCIDEDGNELDRDGDGFGGCLVDCDDYAAQAHPGGTEVCDGLDNNCNGLVDDHPDCPCVLMTIEDSNYLFCTNPLPWHRAASYCAQRDAELAWFESAAESELVYAKSQNLVSGDWYHGLTDSAVEKQWLTVDGQPPLLLYWAAGEPDDFGGEDCAVLTAFGGGQWADVSCSTALPYVCRLEEAE